MMQAQGAPSLRCGHKRCIRLLHRHSPVKGRDRRGPTMGAMIEILTISELMHLTREELCDLSMRIEQGLAELEAGSIGRTFALASLANIRRVMLMRGLNF